MIVVSPSPRSGTPTFTLTTQHVSDSRTVQEQIRQFEVSTCHPGFDVRHHHNSVFSHTHIRRPSLTSLSAYTPCSETPASTLLQTCSRSRSRSAKRPMVRNQSRFIIADKPPNKLEKVPVAKNIPKKLLPSLHFFFTRQQNTASRKVSISTAIPMSSPHHEQNGGAGLPWQQTAESVPVQSPKNSSGSHPPTGTV